MKFFKKNIILFFSILFLFSCQKNVQTNLKATNEYSTYFKIENYKNYKKVTVVLKDQSTRIYILTYDTEKLSDSLKQYTIIKLPIKNAVYFSTTQLGFIEKLDKRETVKGVCGCKYIYDSILFAKYKAGEIEEIGNYPNINTEKIIQIKPDVVFAYDFDSKIANIEQVLNKFNIPVVFVNEYQESHPLGRAEWIKFFGAFLDADSLANKIFSEIETNYKLIAENKKSTPNGILLNIPFQGIWYLPGRESYFVKMLTDAGGNYLWKEFKGNQSYPVNVEKIYSKKDSISIWLNTGRATNLNEILESEPKIKLFYNDSIRIYNNIKRTSKEGGNDFWESGVVRPDLILQDLNKIIENTADSNNLIYYLEIK